MEGLYNDEFNCQKCLKKYGATEGKAAARGEAKRKHKGCFDYSTRTYVLDNIKYASCIGNYSISGLGYYIELYINYEKGIMPYSGGLGSQPNKIIEVLQIIDTIKREKQEAKAKEKAR